MITSWEKLVQNFGTKYGQDINNELNSKLKLNRVMPVHSTAVLVRHATWEALISTGQSNIQLYRQAQAKMFRSEATYDPSDAELPMKIAILENEIVKEDYDLANNIPI